MNLINDIICKRAAFLEVHGCLPEVVYLGQCECTQLGHVVDDLQTRLTGQLPEFKLAGMTIVQVQLPSYCEFGGQLHSWGPVRR
ncbi:hypothetical protein [Chitinilyticum piscinae]|uniref:Uncharacterized protein n=1 Tax=Chitinilyticum piscinae TaxID=2866724 RepID=A0A8J7K7J6_9NEIS|nr:hypothetical protein [Chitinilyticum piscinae]MBE9608173.1 hypothetical protein [Chitinilyticum piscinae]